MTLFKSIIHKHNKRFDTVELHYSVLAPKNWFCRLWRKNFTESPIRRPLFGESYGKTKFEAYRKALKDLTGRDRL